MRLCQPPISPVERNLRTAAFALLAIACSPDSDGTPGGSHATGDDLLVVPEGLANTNVDSEDQGLTLLAFTLIPGLTGPELYAAVRNDGDDPACEAGMITYFFDKAGQAVTSTASVLRSGHLYRMTDGTIISCVPPTQIAMAANALPSSVSIADLGSLQHLFPSFTVNGIVPVAGLALKDVKTEAVSTGHLYTGRLANGLDVTVTAPKVEVFPVNRVGRPLGLATSTASGELPPGGISPFRTSLVSDLGSGYAAYPSATIAE